MRINAGYARTRIFHITGPASRKGERVLIDRAPFGTPGPRCSSGVKARASSGGGGGRDRFTNSRISLVGRGVVVTIILGSLPRRVHISIFAQASSCRCIAANSSTHVRWNCGPRRRSGSSPGKPLKIVPFLSSNSPMERFHLSICLLVGPPRTEIIPLSPSKQVSRTSWKVGATIPILQPSLDKPSKDTCSDASLVLPKPLPASSNQTSHAPSGGNCSTRALDSHLARIKYRSCSRSGHLSKSGGKADSSDIGISEAPGGQETTLRLSDFEGEEGEGARNTGI